MYLAKTRYNQAKRNLQTIDGLVSSSSREVATAKRMYDQTPVSMPVDKIDRKWQLTATEQMVEKHEVEMPAAEKEFRDAYDALAVQYLTICLPEGANAKAVWGVMKGKITPKGEAEESSAAPAPAPATQVQLVLEPNAEKAKVQATVPPVSPKKEKATRHYEYGEPHVKLPRGLAGSPFSDKQPETSEVSLSDKIAANLMQPEIPDSSKVTAARGKDNPVKSGRTSNTVFELTLPIANPDKKSFSEDVINALATSAGIAAKRLEVKEVRDASVHKVNSAINTAAFMQEKAQELHRKYLRNA